MECKILKSDLYGLIQKAYPVVPLKSSLQILSNLKISFSDDTIEISATDLDHSIVVSEKTSSKGRKEITVNAKKIFEIVRELPEGDIFLNVDENVLIIESKKGFSCKIAGTNTNDFPEFPAVQDDISFNIDVLSLKEMIIKSSFAVSKDESRTCLCGILWQVDKKNTGMVATDGHRLGSTFISGNYSVKEKTSMIVAQKTLLHLIRILESTDAASVITVAKDEKYVLFSNENIKICSKLIEGPYPDYDKAIPKNNPKKAIVEKGQLLEAVRRVSVLSNQKTHLVKCILKQEEVEISVFNRDIGGEAHETLPADYTGEQHTIGFNALYLIEIMNIIKQPKIRMEMNTQISACLIFPHYEKEEDKKTEDIFLIMPLRIMEEN
jgi:DNA polymerase III, beta subunit